VNEAEEMEFGYRGPAVNGGPDGRKSLVNQAAKTGIARRGEFFAPKVPGRTDQGNALGKTSPMDGRTQRGAAGR